MAPALGSDELLLVRSLAPPADAVWPGDVVTVEREGALLVRRVAALPGDEMESSVAGDEAFTVRDGYAWVVRDNESCHRAPDSRSFGEVPLDSVKGRVLYGLRSASDHGAVANSERARYNDAPVLAAELNVTALARHVKRDTTKP